MHRSLARAASAVVLLVVLAPGAAGAVTPVDPVPGHVAGRLFACWSEGGCAVLLGVRQADSAPVVVQLEIGDAGALSTPDGPLALLSGPSTVTLDIWRVSDVLTDGVGAFEGLPATCSTTVDVPVDPAGIELAIAATSVGCLVEAAPSARATPSDPPDPASSLLALQALPPDLDPARFGGYEAHPASAPGTMPGATMPFALGHCGLFSPVDLDGSLWDPIAAVDAELGPVDTDEERGELINETDIEAVLVTPDRLDLRTPLGTVVVLARHAGTGDYPICR